MNKKIALSILALCSVISIILIERFGRDKLYHLIPAMILVLCCLCIVKMFFDYQKKIYDRQNELHDITIRRVEREGTNRINKSDIPIIASRIVTDLHEQSFNSVKERIMEFWRDVNRKFSALNANVNLMPPPYHTTTINSIEQMASQAQQTTESNTNQTLTS
jgi:Ca2+/Na+ antiporter